MKIILLLFSFAVLSFFPGCSSLSSTKSAPAELEANVTTKQLSLGDTVLEAVQQADYQKFLACLGGELADNMTQKDFDTSRENMTTQFGTIENFKFLTALQTPTVGNLVWVVTFERNGSEGQQIRQDLLFRVVTAELDNRTVVVSCGFI